MATFPYRTMKNRITASEVRTAIKKQGALLSVAQRKTADEVCDIIYGKIREHIVSKPKDHSIKFTWDWYIWGRKVEHPIQNIFPTVPTGELLWVWDGAEGRSDHPSELGKIVKGQLEADGFTCWIGNGHLEVSW